VKMNGKAIQDLPGCKIRDTPSCSARGETGGKEGLEDEKVDEGYDTFFKP